MNVKQFIQMFFNKIYNKRMLKKANVQYGSNLLIKGRICCSSNGNSTIVIGNDVKINSGKNFNLIGGDTRTILSVNNDAMITIGDRTGISNSTIVAFKGVTIGNDVLIGGSVKIYDTDFHYIDWYDRMNMKGGMSEEIYIKDGAFVGAHSIILKGVTIGERSVIGAGAVVTKDVPADEVWAGNPARFIRKINQEQEI